MSSFLGSNKKSISLIIVIVIIISGVSILAFTYFNTPVDEVTFVEGIIAEDTTWSGLVHVDDTVIEKKEYRSKIFQTSKTCKRPKWIYGAEAENILAKMSNDFNETFAKTYSTKMYSNMDIKIYEK